mgnify:CR=1
MPTSSTRQQLISQMNSQLKELQHNLHDMSKLSARTAELGINADKFLHSQGSFFMSANSVFQQINEHKELEQHRLFENMQGDASK